MALSKKIDAMKREEEELAQSLLEAMGTLGVESLSSNIGTVSIKKTTVAKVVDWDALFKFISRNKAWHLMQRRVSDPAYRELMERRRGKDVPGTESFEKIALGLTKR